MAVVCSVRSTVAVVRLCKDKDVFTTSEGVLEDRSRTEVDIGVIPGRLIGGGAIKVPDAELTDIGHLLGEGLWEISAVGRCAKGGGADCGLGAEPAIAINPDIWGDMSKMDEMGRGGTNTRPGFFRPAEGQGRGRGDRCGKCTQKKT